MHYRRESTWAKYYVVSQQYKNPRQKYHGNFDLRLISERNMSTEFIFFFSQEVRSENQTVSTFPLVPHLSDQGTILTCRVTNPSLPDSVMENSLKLNVHCKWKPIIQPSNSFIEHNPFGSISWNYFFWSQRSSFKYQEPYENLILG